MPLLLLLLLIVGVALLLLFALWPMMFDRPEVIIFKHE